MRALTLLSRRGCCLCEGLEYRLRAVDLASLELEIQVIDIDAPSTAAALKARYDLEVPVLAIDGQELPRVSPRLDAEGLRLWLRRQLSDQAQAP